MSESLSRGCRDRQRQRYRMYPTICSRSSGCPSARPGGASRTERAMAADRALRPPRCTPTRSFRSGRATPNRFDPRVDRRRSLVRCKPQPLRRASRRTDAFAASVAAPPPLPTLGLTDLAGLVGTTATQTRRGSGFARWPSRRRARARPWARPSELVDRASRLASSRKQTVGARTAGSADTRASTNCRAGGPVGARRRSIPRRRRGPRRRVAGTSLLPPGAPERDRKRHGDGQSESAAHAVPDPEGEGSVHRWIPTTTIRRRADFDDAA